MSAREGPIRSIAIAGGGITAWSAAAAIRKRVPAASVTVLPLPVPADALADRIGNTLPSIVEFHRDIGLEEADVVGGTGAGFRLGTLFEGWSGDAPGYVHAYGDYGRAFGVSSFFHHWVRAAQAGRVPPYDSFSPAAELARAGRFVHPQGGADSPLATYEYGLHVDPPRYRELMRAFARHLGAQERPGTLADVRIGADGFVEALLLDDGGELAADLFVDCTGPAALLRSRLGGAFEDWGRWLPCDRILFAEGPPPPDPSPLDRAVAHAAGWRWEAASPARTSHGLVYAAAQLTDARAERVLRAGAAIEPGEAPVAIRAGRLAEPWLRNCVAIGDAAVAMEPLEWANLHLVHSGIDRLISKLPDRDCSVVELWDYNREAGAEADRVRDFALLHYAISSRPKDAFWRDTAAVEPPASLAHTLAMFRERGRLPVYEEETFSRSSWAAVLLGQGAIPRRADPLIDVFPPEQSARAMAQLRDGLAALVPTLPTQGAYLRGILQRGPQ